MANQQRIKRIKRIKIRDIPGDLNKEELEAFKQFTPEDQAEIIESNLLTIQLSNDRQDKVARLNKERNKSRSSPGFGGGKRRSRRRRKKQRKMHRKRQTRRKRKKRRGKRKSRKRKN